MNKVLLNGNLVKDMDANVLQMVIILESSQLPTQ